MATVGREQCKGQLKGGVWCAKNAACETTWEEKRRKALDYTDVGSSTAAMLISPNLFTEEIFLAIKSF